MTAGHVLFVDDDETLCVFISAVLKNAGYTVTSVHDALEGLLVIVDEKPDLIISDISMPGMNGWEFLRKVRDNEHSKNVPFIFLTSAKTTEDYMRARQEGANMVLPKDMGAKLLASAVESVMHAASDQS